MSQSIGSYLWLYLPFDETLKHFFSTDKNIGITECIRDLNSTLVNVARWLFVIQF